MRGEPVPVYKNKTYLMVGILVVFCIGGYYFTNGAIGLGRMKNYQPVQPISTHIKYMPAPTKSVACIAMVVHRIANKPAYLR
ncbi:MAG: hypothetical protein WDM90_04935 [Ferruginibacter sp.]